MWPHCQAVCGNIFSLHRRETCGNVPGMARNTIIKVRVTEEDKEAFIALAKARGVDLSKLIRSLLKGQGQ